MRRLFAAVAIVLCVACGSDLLDPVMVVDGEWTGQQNGYSISIVMSQSGTSVSGTVALAGVGGAADGTLSGTFVYPNLNVTMSLPGFDPFSYVGTMSGTQAKINGHLTGSGFNNVEIDVAKQ